MGTHDLRIRLAQIAAQEGRPQEAVHLYAQVLAGNPYQPEAWYGLSRVVAEPERAAYCLQRVVDISPSYLDDDNRLLDVLLKPAAMPHGPETAVQDIVENWPVEIH